MDLNSYPDGGYEAVAMSEDGHIYCLDTVGAVDNTDWVDDYYSDSTSAEYPIYRASPVVADIDEDKEVDIIFGPNSYNKESDTDYTCYPNAIKWGMFGAGTKHDGNGDNRFAILIEGTGTGASNTFEKNQYKYHIQEMGQLLTEHPGNTKPGPGYTGYYLQDHISYVGDHNVFPYLDRDATITRDNILEAIKDVAKICDSYDKVILFYTSYGALSGTTSFFDVNNDNTITFTFGIPDDIDANMLDNYLDTIECKDMIIILQPSYSGDWITDLKQDVISSITYPEKNRVILTSERSGQTAEFDLCNEKIDDNDKRYVKQDSTEEDDEKFYNPPAPNTYLYVVMDKANNIQDEIYEVNRDNEDSDEVIDFYENFNDFGSEFVSGLTEAYYIDRDYYYASSHHESNGYLDADDYDIDPENIEGNENKYVSCKEAYDFMLNWHLNYRLGSGSIGKPGTSNPWYDFPQKEFTWMEEGSIYIF